MAPSSSISIDDFSLLTQDFLDAAKDNPALATNRELRNSAKYSLQVATLLQSKGEDDELCASLLRKLLDLMENVYDTFKTTRPEMLLGPETIRITERFSSILEVSLSDLLEAFEDAGTLVAPEVIAMHEKEMNELREDIEDLRKTLAGMPTRASTASQGEETFRKTSMRAGTDVNNMTVSKKPKSHWWNRKTKTGRGIHLVPPQVQTQIPGGMSPALSPGYYPQRAGTLPSNAGNHVINRRDAEKSSKFYSSNIADGLDAFFRQMRAFSDGVVHKNIGDPAIEYRRAERRSGSNQDPAHADEQASREGQIPNRLNLAEKGKARRGKPPTGNE